MKNCSGFAVPARIDHSTAEVMQVTLAGTQPAQLAELAPLLQPPRLGPQRATSQKALVPVTRDVTSHGAKHALKLSQLGEELGDRGRVLPASRIVAGADVLGHCLQTSCWCR